MEPEINNEVRAENVEPADLTTTATATATTTTTPTRPEEDKPQAQLSNWLPITASRKAKWWYSAFHNVTAMVGAGVLGLPFALSQLGWFIYFLFFTHIFSYNYYTQLYNQNTLPINGTNYLSTFII